MITEHELELATELNGKIKELKILIAKLEATKISRGSSSSMNGISMDGNKIVVNSHTLNLLQKFKDDIVDELGDYFWYGAGLATELGIDLATEIPVPHTSFKWDIELSGLGLGTSGLVQNELKKIIRDDESVVTSERLYTLTQLVIAYMESGFEVCNSLEIRPSEVFQRNIDKLFSRQERGVIKGSGDNR